MNGPEPTPNACGCGEAAKPLTPAEISNLPGQAALACRVGTQRSFKTSMLAGLSRQAALTQLTTRADDDPAISLTDAWAAVLDVLTFYQERIANEGYFNTATERRSVLELARSIGYEPRPGVAASTCLAFTLEDTQGAPRQVTIGVGTRAQSVPEQDEKPQIFETVEEIVARPEWNKLCPQLLVPQKLTIKNGTLRFDGVEKEAQALYLKGNVASLKVGDLLLVVLLDAKNTLPLARRIRKVEFQDKKDRTRVTIEASSADAESLPVVLPSTMDQTSALSDNSSVPLPFNEQNVKRQVLERKWRERDLQAFLKIHRWNADDLVKQVTDQNQRSLTPEDQVQSVYAFRERVGFFGNNAPSCSSLRDRSDNPLYKDDWDTDGWSIWKTYPDNSPYRSVWPADVFLERTISGVSPDGWTVFANAASRGRPLLASPQHLAINELKALSAGPERTADAMTSSAISISQPKVEVPASPGSLFNSTLYFQSYRISDVMDASLTGFGMSGRVTGLSLSSPGGEPPDKQNDFLVRPTVAYVGSERLESAPLPVEDIIEQGATALMLDRMVLGLQTGRLVVLNGENKDAPGVKHSEMLVLDEIIHEKGYTTLHFHRDGSQQGLAHGYLRSSVTLNANVARATHGETKSEVMGSGDASQGWQKFVLKQSPLTHVSAPTPSGTTSTLKVLANDLLWDEERSFYQLPANEKAFVTRLSDDGRTTVQFGDGVSGARLPSGTENVRASYRVGTGVAGMVKAGQISVLLSRPLGLKEVTNPLAATGAADSENRDQVRQNAPLAVLALDRIVSLQDYEDFARAFAGIGKAQAVWLWNGEKKLVHITIAGATGEPVSETSELYKNLGAAIRAAGGPAHYVRLDSFEPLFFDVRAKLLVRREYVPEKVIQAATAALQAAYSFPKRAFAQAVPKSEVMAILQAVEGVEAVDLDYLFFSSQTATAEDSTPDALPARTAQGSDDDSATRGAELLLVNPYGISLTEMKLV